MMPSGWTISSSHISVVFRAPALPAQFVRVVACAVRGPSPANRSAPQTGGRFGRGAQPPAEGTADEMGAGAHQVVELARAARAVR